MTRRSYSRPRLDHLWCQKIISSLLQVKVLKPCDQHGERIEIFTIRGSHHQGWRHRTVEGKAGYFLPATDYTKPHLWSLFWFT